VETRARAALFNQFQTETLPHISDYLGVGCLRFPRCM
jgi:hypothetical protein